MTRAYVLLVGIGFVKLSSGEIVLNIAYQFLEIVHTV